MTARLHILNKAPDHPRYRHCLDALEPGDSLILMESGVLALLADPMLPSRLEGIQVYALRDDLAACSRSAGPGTGVDVIDYREFVNLICQIGSPVGW